MRPFSYTKVVLGLHSEELSITVHSTDALDDSQSFQLKKKKENPDVSI